MERITTTGQVMVVVVFAHDNPAKGENHDARLRLMEHIKKSFPGITSLQYIINTNKIDSFADLPVVPYHRERLYNRTDGEPGVPGLVPNRLPD
jgi:23S rRNA (uracil1939-C5)-methyltransferase